MIKPRYYQMFRALPILSRAQFSRLWRVILGLSQAPGAECDVATQLRMFAYEWLVHLGFLSEDRIRWILTQIDAQLIRIAGWIEKNWPDLGLAPPMLTIADKRYVKVDGADWIDSETESLTVDRDVWLVTYISIDLFAVFVQKQSWLQRFKEEGTDAQRATSGANQPA